MKQKYPQSVIKKSQKTIQTVKPNNWKYYLALICIILITFIAYLPVLQNGFVWDDQLYIISNTLLNPVNLVKIFSQNVGGNYHPITILALAAEFHFFGLDEAGYHTINLLLHLMNVILVFYTVFLLSDKVGVALIVSLLFGIHPLHVESVAWVSELKDLLYTFFFLASYYFYLKYLSVPRQKYYVLALLLFAVSLLSKAMAASLPLLLVLTDYFKGRNINLKTLTEKIPFFLLALIFGIIAIFAQQHSSSILDLSVFTYPQRIVFACYGFITYLYKLILPIQLSAYYPYPIKSGGTVPFLFYIHVILFFALITFVIYSLRKTKKVFFGLGFFAVTVFLVVQLLPVGNTIMADRYSYISSIGIFYLAGEAFYLIWGKKLKLTAILLVGLLTVFYSLETYARCSVWKNGMTLWTDVIEQDQTIASAYYNRGNYFMNHGGFKEALNDFNKTIELAPNHFDAINNRGTLYMDHNLNDSALKDFNKAIALKPDLSKAYYNRGNIFMLEKKFDQSIKDFSKTIQLNPNDFESYVNRGYVLTIIGRNEEALHDYNKAIEINPGQVQTYMNRGYLFMILKQNIAALNDFSKAIELKPDLFAAYHNRGVIYYTQKKFEEAILNYSTAIAIKTDFTEAYLNRGLAEYYTGRKNEACKDMEHAARLGSKAAADSLFQMCR